jgi:curved DNA-binding protein CbpA
LQTLGLKPGQEYSLHEIKKAYRRRVLDTHPDAGGTNDELRQVVNAWDTRFFSLSKNNEEILKNLLGI